jgi:hypothetical protein
MSAYFPILAGVFDTASKFLLSGTGLYGRPHRCARAADEDVRSPTEVSVPDDFVATR